MYDVDLIVHGLNMCGGGAGGGEKGQRVAVATSLKNLVKQKLTKRTTVATDERLEFRNQVIHLPFRQPWRFLLFPAFPCVKLITTGYLIET